MKHDLRYIKTEKAIRKALHELAQEKDINKITVKELSERAEINKTTFYSHYETLPILIQTLENEIIEYIISNLDRVTLLFEDSDKFIDNLYNNLQDCNINGINKFNIGDQHFANLLAESIEKEVILRNINTSKYSQISSLLTFIIYGLLGVVKAEKSEIKDIESIKKFVKIGIMGINK